MNVPLIDPAQVHNRRSRGEPVELIDVRTPVEFRELHAQDARNVPLDKLDPASLVESLGGKDRPLYLLCRTGSRAERACDQFHRAGFDHVTVVDGGTEAWNEAGLPVVRGKKAMSLERQVRIGAGSLVLAGVALGWWVHPAWFVLSAFVGGGLIFAGVTDFCGMAMVLARMPWNQVREAPAEPPCASGDKSSGCTTSHDNSHSHAS